MNIPLNNSIPALGLGTYPLRGQECQDAVSMALDLGYTHIDTAQMYGNESDVGQAIKGSARDTLFITTKIDPSNLAPDRFASSIRKSMDDLGGPADLLLIHWPPEDHQVDAMLDLLQVEHQRGMAKWIGVSNFSSKLLRQATKRISTIACNQVEFHPLLDQSKLKATSTELGIPLVAYSPIARGAALKHQSIIDIATQHGRPPSEIVLRWIVQQGVIAIPMTTKRQNAASNLRIFDFELAPSEMGAISALGAREGRTVYPGWMQGRFDE